MKMILGVGLSGMAGAWFRYMIGGMFGVWWVHSFPLSTFIINLLGCFALAALHSWTSVFTRMSAWVRDSLAVGFIGSFTTFSTFSVEAMTLMRHHEWAWMILYLLLSLWGGLLAAWAGTRLFAINAKTGSE